MAKGFAYLRVDVRPLGDGGSRERDPPQPLVACPGPPGAPLAAVQALPGLRIPRPSYGPPTTGGLFPGVSLFLSVAE